MAGDRAVSWLPLYHDMGLVGMLLSGLACQCSVDLLPTGAFVRRPSLWLELISSRQATISYAPTFGYELAARRAQAANPESLDLTSWRVAGVGGDMIRPAPLEAFARAFSSSGFSPSTFVPSYGMAETTLGLTLAPLGQGIRTDRIDVEALERRQSADPRHREGTRTRDFALCGKVLPGHRIEVRDQQGKPLAERRMGRIFASGPSLMTSYFGEPKETARVLSKDGWLDTGDLGYAFDGQIVITGRAKDLIIINGRNVWPQDLEWTAESEIAALRSGDVAVFSVNGADQERIIALVQCRTGAAETREDLRAQTAGLFRTRHGLEAEVVLIPPHSLPQTSSGKLSRSSAKSLFLSGAFEARTAKVDA
jgi:fatty-acyl-CoA synthase